MTATECHETFLSTMLRDPPITRLRLVARLEDDLIANPNPSSLYIFIPDLHLVSDEQLIRYSYHFNQWETFYRMLFRIQDARKTLSKQGNPLEVIHLGDLYDLWREAPRREQTPVVDRIIEDHLPLVKMLYRHRAGLRARVLVGNHDAGMIGTPQFYLRLFLPKEAPGAFCLAIHGDWFDSVERLPNWLKRFGVYIAARGPQPGTVYLGDVRKMLRRKAQAADGFKSHIRLRAPTQLGKLRRLRQPETRLPRRLNVTRTSQNDRVHPFLPSARQAVHRFRKEAKASPAWRTTRLIVIGHSHHARISVDDTADPAHPVVLMDCGAWIEKYKDNDGNVYPNCQVGVIAGNDIRIYQLDPLD
jgi:UDP-2,3-diacylglucosamine pyrophosphatase LpxH